MLSVSFRKIAHFNGSSTNQTDENKVASQTAAALIKYKI